MRSFNSITITLSLLTTSVYANCYVGNGSDRNVLWGEANRYTPCDLSSGGASMCCSQTEGGDRCRPVGSLAASLCWNQGNNQLWRESCTDYTWSNTNCLKLFMNVSDTDVQVTNCSAAGLGEGYCYGSLNLGCCRAGQAVFIDPNTGEQVSTNPALATSSASSTTATTRTTRAASASTSTSSSTPSPTSTQSPASSSGLSTGAKAGIGVGIALGAVLILAIAGFLFMRSRRAKKPKELPATGEYLSSPTSPHKDPPKNASEIFSKTRGVTTHPVELMTDATGRNGRYKSPNTYSTDPTELPT